MQGMKSVSLGGVNLHFFHSRWHEEGEIATSFFAFFFLIAFSSPFINTSEINNTFQNIYNKPSADFKIGKGGEVAEDHKTAEIKIVAITFHLILLSGPQQVPVVQDA